MTLDVYKIWIMIWIMMQNEKTGCEAVIKKVERNLEFRYEF